MSICNVLHRLPVVFPKVTVIHKKASETFSWHHEHDRVIAGCACGAHYLTHTKSVKREMDSKNTNKMQK